MHPNSLNSPETAHEFLQKEHCLDTSKIAHHFLWWRFSLTVLNLLLWVTSLMLLFQAELLLTCCIISVSEHAVLYGDLMTHGGCRGDAILYITRNCHFRKPQPQACYQEDESWVTWVVNRGNKKPSHHSSCSNWAFQQPSLLFLWNDYREWVMSSWISAHVRVVAGRLYMIFNLLCLIMSMKLSTVVN